ncbi:MAG: hypothetical protein AB8H79_13815 [Myxococcota bacterium]
MFVGLLAAGLALADPPAAIAGASDGARPPTELRDDGTMIAGCSSIDWVSEHDAQIPALAKPMLSTLSLFGQLGIDTTAPVWVVMRAPTAKSTQTVPVDAHFTMPAGKTIPGIVSLLPGSPRPFQDGTSARLKWGLPLANSTELRPWLDRAIDGAGCSAVFQGDPKDNAPTAIHLGGDGSRLTVVTPKLVLPASFPAETQIITRLLGEPVPPKWPALAVTQTVPDVRGRLNMELPIDQVLRALGQDPDKQPKAVRRVRLHPGTELALFFGDPQTSATGEVVRPVDYALVVPIRRPRTVRWWAGKLASQLEKQERPVERRGRLVGMNLSGGTEIDTWISSRRGRFIISTNPDIIEDLRENTVGTPWFPEDWSVPTAADRYQPGLLLDLKVDGLSLSGVVKKGEWTQADLTVSQPESK